MQDGGKEQDHDAAQKKITGSNVSNNGSQDVGYVGGIIPTGILKFASKIIGVRDGIKAESPPTEHCHARRIPDPNQYQMKHVHRQNFAQVP